MDSAGGRRASSGEGAGKKRGVGKEGADQHWPLGKREGGVIEGKEV